MDSTLFINVPHLAPMALDKSEPDGLTFWKELIYVGKFKKGKQDIPVDEALLKHWEATSAKMLSNGVDIPLPVEHTTDPEKNRGKCIGMKVERNRRGIPALFGKIRFRDKAAAELAKTANVSIFADTKAKDGLGNEYEYPIVHVALTDYPVIPALGGFQPIAASFNEEKPMAIDPRKLAEKLGVAADTADADLEAAIGTAIDELLKKVEKAGTPSNDSKEGSGDNKPAPAVAASFGKLLAKNRAGEIDALVLSHRVTPAAAAKLKAQFCNPETLSLAFSQGDENDAGFDATIDALKLQEPYVPTSGKSGPQVLELSNNDLGDAGKNPLLKNAKERAAQFK